MFFAIFAERTQQTLINRIKPQPTKLHTKANIKNNNEKSEITSKWAKIRT
jgi:hypothetical protein